LLENAESGLSAEVLRIWESPVYFVVLGYSSKWKNEVKTQNCKKDRVVILRRKSGGATVLQGPGCLNFALVLEARENSGIKSDTGQVMKTNLKAATAWELSDEIKIQGISDLTWKKRKFSGNAMRRGKNFFLFHGTFLYQFDIQKISHYLGSPDREPSYRAQRSHADFLTNIPVKKQTLIDSLRMAWDAKEDFGALPSIDKLKSEVYSQSAWNLKY
jgi:lipoate-protein ligase A